LSLVECLVSGSGYGVLNLIVLRLTSWRDNIHKRVVLFFSGLKSVHHHRIFPFFTAKSRISIPAGFGLKPNSNMDCSRAD